VSSSPRLHRWFGRITAAAALLAFVVILAGAWVRLTDAGLGCPDWPGCYGRISAPDAPHEVAAAEEAFPHAPVDSGKAWREMAHRYLAGALGLMILALSVVAWLNRDDPRQQRVLPFVTLAIVIVQAALGMWTVTLLLRPAIVTLHLLMGMGTLALLGWMALRHYSPGAVYSGKPPAVDLRPWAAIGLVILAAQIALGGWTSTNYAALACPDFPTCQARWLPELEFSGAFSVFGTPGVNYEGGRLEPAQALTVHFMHRLGALVTLLYLGFLGLLGATRGGSVNRAAAIVLLAALALQISLGIANVLLGLPLVVAVAHNGGGALLLMALVALTHTASQHYVSIHSARGLRL
jgi:cytochrome c oxidase assembly protein subunit 15